MCFNVNCKNEQDIENMLSAYLKQVIVQSRKKFDKSCCTHLRHEELTLNGEIEDLEISDVDEIENLVFTEECNKISFTHIEIIFADERLYEAVKSLKAKQKKVLHLIFIKEKSEQEVADILKLSRQGVNYIKNTAVAKIIKTYLKQA